MSIKRYKRGGVEKILIITRVKMLQMWRFMESHSPSVFVTNYDEGIARVKGGDYAFLMESTMLDYVVQVLIRLFMGLYLKC